MSLDEPLAACARGEVAPNLALMRLFMLAETEVDARAAFDSFLAAHEQRAPSGGLDRLRDAHALWEETPAGFATVKAVLAVEQGDIISEAADPIAVAASAFDSAALLSAEASVALYSLGRADILDSATREIVDTLRGWGHLERAHYVLEIGCGTGRCLPLLARETASVTGIDISQNMVEAARRRVADCPNATVLQGNGRDLSALSDGAFDLVLAVDVFPYLVREGRELIPIHVCEAARILRPGGALVVLNYSYRGDVGDDCDDVLRLARRYGFVLRRNGIRPFRLWDGLAFDLCKV